MEPKRGLTQSLILGCGSARARVLARQDAADYSFPWRLRSQLDLLEREPSVSFVSCWTECVGPDEEPLQVLEGGRATDEPLRLSLSSSTGPEVVGPTWHGSTLFRRDAYLRTGGYRPEFRMAQDWDLWWRLSETGAFALVPRVLYRARILPGSLSMCHPGVQRRFAKLGREAFEARLAGGGDQAIVARAGEESESVGDLCQTRRGRSRGEYFIGSRLQSIGDVRAANYFRAASRSNPLHLKAWLRWFQTR